MADHASPVTPLVLTIPLLLMTSECEMLVITRKKKERIKIGDDVVITVLRTQAGHVRLGIEAPRGVPIVRDELPPLPHSPAGLKEG